MSKTKQIEKGGVDEYIRASPEVSQVFLRKIRSAIQEAAPESVETVSYFSIPGYSYEGYSYNGMFTWFSYKKPFIRLHVIPPVIDNYSKELANYKTTKSVVSFPADEELPILLIKKLVKASIKEMKRA